MAKVSLPSYKRAVKTEAAIKEAIELDGGARFRGLLFKHLPTIADAYNEKDETNQRRSHLGASVIGTKCVRELWLGWRWAFEKNFDARMLRLFNRGHQEEARFLAMLDMIGVEFHQPDDGKQERIEDHGGHFGSALDGVLWNVPDCPGEWILGEFKTFNTKQFSKLVNEGVMTAKPQHFEQMQICMARRGLSKALYMATNKNDDDLFCQLINLSQPHVDAIRAKAARTITRLDAPMRIAEDPSHFDCTFCDAHQRCHFPDQVEVARHCRSCKHSIADIESGQWGCMLLEKALTKEEQLDGCPKWDVIPALAKR